jgi:hypothetical protein
MYRTHTIGTITFAGVALMLSHCASTPHDPPSTSSAAVQSMGVVAPHTRVERKILALIGQVKPNTPTEVDDCLLVAEAPYFAASGRRCRKIRVTYKDRNASVRLVCENGRSWVYVPNVFPDSPQKASKP